MSLAAGTLLGSHEIVGLLGAGGMGEVYRARDTKLNRQVAIKILPEAYAADPDRVARFHREAQAVAALNHPNIAGIHDLAESGSTKFLVLELIEGDTLADRLRRGPLPVEEALLVIKQVLEALEAAHEKGICHRDLKPANIKLTPDGVVKVLDFGLAKFTQSPSSAPLLTNSPTLSVAGTYPGVILGTAGYMSPEQAKGHEADHRSDLFSVGCILYELLSGHQAFEGETASEILAGVLKSEIDLTRLPARLNPRLIDVLRRCLEKNPKRRWHASADVRVEIESLIGRSMLDGVSATSEAQPGWRRLVPISLGMVIGALLASLTLWVLKPEAERPIARFSIDLPEGQSFSGFGRPMIAVAPDGQHIVYAANNRLYRRALSAADPVEIAGSNLGGVTLNPVFSPDGQSVAFWSQADSTIKRLPLGGGGAVTVCKATAPYGLHWSEHGLVFGQPQPPAGIFLVPAVGGDPELIAASDSNELLSQPQLLADGSAVIFAVRINGTEWDQANIVVQPRGGSRLTLIEGGADPRLLPSGHLAFARGGSLLAVPFDATRRRISGKPVPVVDGVRRVALSPSGATTGALQFSFSNDGLLAFLPGPTTGVSEARLGSDLAIFDSKGGHRLLGLAPRTYRSPRISPDGASVAFAVEDARESSIWIHELTAQRTPQRLTLTGRNRYPTWSADGRSIVFQSDREGDRGLFRQQADGATVAQRLTRPSANAEHVPHSASPDGRYLLMSVLENNVWTLSILSLADGRVTPFGDVRSAERTDGAFSPDGKWIAYQTRQAIFERRVYVEPFPRTGSQYLVGRGGHPVFVENGRAIIINVGIANGQLFPFTTEPRVGFGNPETVPRVNRLEENPAIAPRMFDPFPGTADSIGVAVKAGFDADEGRRINIIYNWFTDVRQRVPR